jgi:hypothetical protein
MLALMFAIAHLASTPGETAGEEPVLRTTTAPKPEKIRKADTVCRREAVVGTRMKTRICMTQSEWEQRGGADRDNVEKVQSLKPLVF